jgi:Flp pilus assembly pilin Flp
MLRQGANRMKELKRKLRALLRFLGSKQGRGIVQYALLMGFVVLTATAYGTTLARQINKTYISIAYTFNSHVR